MAISEVKFGENTSGLNSGDYTPNRNPNIGSEVSSNYEGIIVQKALGGKTFTLANHESSRRQRRLIYENLDEINKDYLVALFNFAKGQKNSFHYTETGNFADSFEVRFVNNKLPVSETAYNVYRVEINIEEQL